MTHDELLAKVNEGELGWYYGWMQDALRAVVELHKPEYWENIHDPSWNGNDCSVCFTDGNLEVPSARVDYPCPTIQAIEKELACDCCNSNGKCKECGDAQKKELS